MPSSPLVPALPDSYTIDARKVPRSSRSDWTVARIDADTPADSPEFVGALRRFLVEFDAEIERHKHDPIATGQALTKLEAIAADVRHLTNRLREVTARSMMLREVRRIVVEGVGVWEASSSVKRTNWRIGPLVAAYLTRQGIIKAITIHGEMIEPSDLGELIADLFGSTDPRLTPLKAVGIDPDVYCDIERDEDSKPVRTPAVRVVVNETRRDGSLK
jgi:hypothetical protein